MDLNILNWINANLHGDSFLNFIFAFITNSGNTGFIWIILSLVFMLFKKTRKCGFIMFVSLGVSFVLVDMILKPLILRPRPFFVDSDLMPFIKSSGVEIPTSSSFPSGHSSSSLATSFALFFYNKKWGKPAVFYGFLVAISRVYFGVHYPTDVLAGILIGVLVAYVVNIIAKKLENFYLKKRGVIKIRDYIST